MKYRKNDWHVLIYFQPQPRLKQKIKKYIRRYSSEIRLIRVCRDTFLDSYRVVIRYKQKITKERAIEISSDLQYYILRIRQIENCSS